MNVALPPARSVSLFAGVGGLDLGVELAFGTRAVAYCEADPFCAAVLAARMADGALGQAPIWSDVRTFDGRALRGKVDLVAGGSPCQDLSFAGNQAGLAGDRSGLWFEQLRVVRECEPRFVVWENVGGAIAEALPVVAGGLEDLGFRVAACTLRALDVGAPHRRERVFLLAHADRERCEAGGLAGVGPGLDGARGFVADGRGVSRGRADVLRGGFPSGPREWRAGDEPKPGVRRGLDGAETWLECSSLRLHALGNGVVPQQAAVALLICWERLFGAPLHLE